MRENDEYTGTGKYYGRIYKFADEPRTFEVTDYCSEEAMVFFDDGTCEYIDQLDSELYSRVF